MPRKCHDQSGIDKGKFVSQKNFKAKQSRREAAVNRWKRQKDNALKAVIPPVPSRTGNITGSMRRLVEFRQFFSDLWCKHCKKPVFMKDYVSEKQHGLAFVYKVLCRSCQGLIEVHTDKQSTSIPNVFDVNLKMVSGGVDGGSGVGPLNNILSALNVPAITQTLYTRHENYIAPAFELVAQESCLKGIRMEKSLTDSGTMTESSTSMLSICGISGVGPPLHPYPTVYYSGDDKI